MHTPLTTFIRCIGGNYDYILWLHMCVNMCDCCVGSFSVGPVVELGRLVISMGKPTTLWCCGSFTFTICSCELLKLKFPVGMFLRREGCKTQSTDPMFHIRFVVGLIWVACGWSSLISLMPGDSLCAIVFLLGIGCVHCWLFLWALIAKPVDCVIRLCCWIYDCSFHLAVVWILFRVSHCINFRELRLSDCPWGPCFELSPRSSPVELGFWGPFGLLVSIFTSRVFVWVRVNFDFCQC